MIEHDIGGIKCQRFHRKALAGFPSLLVPAIRFGNHYRGRGFYEQSTGSRKPFTTLKTEEKPHGALIMRTTKGNDLQISSMVQTTVTSLMHELACR